jgi:pyruvate/2-oxoglutarate dehydrogenase complex dihydrolipoamide dehydrogenase (E3) component
MTVASPRQSLVLPDDEHNQQLVGHVHPGDWTNPDPAGRYNLVVIGAGTAGLVSAVGAAGLGAKVAIIERHLMGGDCLNYGCVPSKALIRAARAVADVRNASRFGARVEGDPDVDFGAVMARMRELRAGISHHDSVARLAGLGIDVFLGDATFVSPDAIEVDGKTLRFARAVVASGARAFVPPIPGLAEAGCVTNETVFSLTELPRRLVVVGAGPIGCELAQSFRRLGSEVVVVSLDPRILPREDPDASAIVQRTFEQEGIVLELGAGVTRVEQRDGRKVVVFERDGREGEVVGDEVLVAIGRAANVDGLGLDAAGIAADRKGVTVDDHLRTTNRRVYAAGDVATPYKFTHSADAMARMVLQNAFFFGRKKVSELIIPWCTYTDPEVAHVGLYEDEARARGLDFVTLTVPMRDVDRAVLDGDTEGFARVLADKKGRVLGATMVAGHAGEMIGEMALAMTAGATLGTVSGTIHPYPTQAEAWKKLGDAWNRTRLTPRVKSIFGMLFRWRR